jgi:hypothetical protein
LVAATPADVPAVAVPPTELSAFTDRTPVTELSPFVAAAVGAKMAPISATPETAATKDLRIENPHIRKTPLGKEGTTITKSEVEQEVAREWRGDDRLGHWSSGGQILVKRRLYVAFA